MRTSTFPFILILLDGRVCQFEALCLGFSTAPQSFLVSCHLASLQLGEIRPQADQHGSVSQGTDGSHLRVGVSDGFSDCQISGSGRQVSSLPCKDVASLELFVPRKRAKVCPLQWGLKAHWSVASDDAAIPVPLSSECNQCIGW